MAKKLPCQILTFDENGASQTHTHSPFHKPSKAHARTHSHAQDLSSSLKIAGRHICNFQPVSLESSHSGLSVHECKPRHLKVGLFCTQAKPIEGQCYKTFFALTVKATRSMILAKFKTHFASIRVVTYYQLKSGLHTSTVSTFLVTFHRKFTAY